MPELKLIRETKPRTIIDRYYTELIVPKPFSTLGSFIKARRPSWDSRISAEEKETKDRRKYGTCIGCGHKFSDEENMYFAQSVRKNSKNLGNLMACENCARAFNNGRLETDTLVTTATTSDPDTTTDTDQNATN